MQVAIYIYKDNERYRLELFPRRKYFYYFPQFKM